MRFPLLQIKILIELIIAPFMMLIPKNKRKIVFGAWRGKQFSCNPRYLFEYTVRRGGFKCIWVGDRELANAVRSIPGAVFVRKGSFMAFWHAITAWVYVFNIMWEEDIIRFPRYGRVNLVYTTHGYLDKKIGRLQYNGNGEVNKYRKKSFQWLRNIQRRVISWLYKTESWCSECSELAVQKMLEGQQVELRPERMLRFGHPRADYFIHYGSSVDEKRKQRAIYAKKLNLPMNKKWYLFVPTWRHEKEYLYSFLASKRRKEIEGLLNEQNAIIIEKQHPIVLETMLDFDGQTSDLLYSIDRIQARSIDTQGLLMACDRLITDYSSIYFDYVLMNRPVVHFTYDYDHFMNLDFGFLYDFRQYGGGPFANTEDELISFLEMSDDELIAMRSPKTRTQLLEYAQGNACENYYALFEKFANSKSFFAL